MSHPPNTGYTCPQLNNTTNSVKQRFYQSSDLLSEITGKTRPILLFLQYTVRAKDLRAKDEFEIKS